MLNFYFSWEDEDVSLEKTFNEYYTVTLTNLPILKMVEVEQSTAQYDSVFHRNGDLEVGPTRLQSSLESTIAAHVL